MSFGALAIELALGKWDSLEKAEMCLAGALLLINSFIEKSLLF